MPTMPKMFRPGVGVGIKQRTARQEHDERRGTAAERMYGGWWQRARRKHLRANPLCVCCQANGYIRAASLVDHIVPHRGDAALFRNSANWQSLCAECHNKIKPVLERAYEAGKIAAEMLRLDRLLPDWFDTSCIGDGNGKD